MSQTYPVYSFLMNRQGRLGLYSLLNLLQDTSMAHSNSLGHGHQKTSAEKHAFWVLTRQKVSMKDWPHWNSEITIRTWVRPADGAFAIRDFEISVGKNVIGEAVTSYLLLDSVTRKPKSKGAGFLDYAAREEGHLLFEAEKIAPRTGATTVARFEVRNSDIDMNNHVNNTRYSQWILDAIPIERHSQVVLRDYAVNFVAETKLGDVVEVQAIDADPTSYFQGIRLSDQKIVFTAELTRA